jgi:anti-sigma-K factor RskA
LSTVTATAEKAPLDEVMLAMDVVDTLRHRQDLVERELAGDAREKQLIEKLREIYSHQGIEVTDEVLRAGVKALAESRFAYTPPKPSLSTTLARAYVSRRKWGPATLAIVLVLVVGLGGYFLAWQPFQAAQVEAARIELAEGLPKQMDALYQTIYEETKVQQAVTDAETIRTRGKALASEGNRAGALQAIADLTALRDTLRSEYTLKIYSKEGERSAFWREPKINSAAMNFYIVVQAIGADGKALTMPITNEETGKTESVALWGVRVPESTYRTVENDKRDDGIIERATLGLKEYGFLAPDYVMPVLGGAVTEW